MKRSSKIMSLTTMIILAWIPLSVQAAFYGFTAAVQVEDQEARPVQRDEGPIVAAADQGVPGTENFPVDNLAAPRRAVPTQASAGNSPVQQDSPASANAHGASGRSETFIACQAPDQASHGGWPIIHCDPAFGSSAAESFTATGSDLIGKIRWWGAYLTQGTFTPCASVGTDDFTVTIYANSGGMPGSVVSYNPLGATVLRELTGLSISFTGFQHPEYRYTADLIQPFTTTPGTTYWVEVARADVDACSWWWETAPVGADGDGSALWDESGGGFVAHSFDLALCVFEPPAPFVDCNENGIDDPCDIACGSAGEPCDVPGCGLSADIDDDGVPDDCQDCNGNGIVDSCDISCGSAGGPCDVPNCGLSADANGNGVPDDCEDCNQNGVLDSVDIASCESPDMRCLDCNGDGRPDECDVRHVTCFDADCNDISDLCEQVDHFDCNLNGIHDLMDIANGTSIDLNTNCRPDECDVPPSSGYAGGLCNAEWLPQSNCCSAHPESTGCDDLTCESIVCAGDPWCCSDQWDGICAQTVQNGACGATYCGDTSCLRDSNENGIPDEAENECLTKPGDAEFDCDADVRDFLLFQICFTGAVGPTYPAAYEAAESNEVHCDCLDTDFDGDVDYDDFDAFHSAIESPDPLCQVCPDIWSTTVGATTQFEFKDDGVVQTAIPAGFFGNNSAEFLGAVELIGVRTPTLDLNDESESRFDTQVLHPLPEFQEIESCPHHSTVPLMIRGLRLVSKNPVFVPSTAPTADCNSNGCTDAEEIDPVGCAGSACGCSPDDNGDGVPDECQEWLLSVNLSHTRPAIGRLHAWTTHSEGGFFSAQLNVQPVFYFTLLQDVVDQKPISQVRRVVFDTGSLGIDPMQMLFEELPWAKSVGDSAGTDIFVLSCAEGNFVPAYDTTPGIPGVWWQTGRRTGLRDDPEPTCTSHLTPEEAHYFCPPECNSVEACHYFANFPALPGDPEYCGDCSQFAQELPEEMWTGECDLPCNASHTLYAECGLNGNGDVVNCIRFYALADPPCSYSDDYDEDGTINACDQDADGDGFDGPLADGPDCDDLNELVNPDAPEICDDGIDNDCDELIDGDDDDC